MFLLEFDLFLFTRKSYLFLYQLFFLFAGSLGRSVHLQQKFADDFAFTELLLLAGGFDAHEKRLEPIFDHVFGAMGEKLFAELCPFVTVFKDKVKNSSVFELFPGTA